MPASPARPGGGVPQDAWTHRDDLVRFAVRLLGAERAAAEDVVQEAYLRLHERAAQGTPVREPRPWLFRVTRNLAIDHRRQTRRHDDVRTALELAAPATPGPLQIVQGREEMRATLEGVGALPPRERHAVILSQAGLEPAAIARRTASTPNAVHQALFRARRRLRDARAAAWGLVPLPLVRLASRAAGGPVLERVAAVPGGGRGAGGAALAAALAVGALVGGGPAGVVPLPHPSHARDAAPARARPAATAAAAAPAAPPPAVAHPVGVGTPVAARTTAVVRARTLHRPSLARREAAAAAVTRREDEWTPGVGADEREAPAPEPTREHDAAPAGAGEAPSTPESPEHEAATSSAGASETPSRETTTPEGDGGHERWATDGGGGTEDAEPR
ncbi:MAG: RNA polymerase sigma factor [Thermoleophilia bacterium]